MSKPNVADLAVGTKVRVVLDGEVITSGGVKRIKVAETPSARPTAYGVQRRTLPQMLPSSVIAQAKEFAIVGPTWQPGDVVVVRYHGPRSIAYTYVRGAKDWPGDRRASKSDAEITGLFGEGKVEHVMRDGKPVVKPVKIEGGQISAADITAASLLSTAPRPAPRPRPTLYGAPTYGRYPF